MASTNLKQEVYAKLEKVHGKEKMNTHFMEHFNKADEHTSSHQKVLPIFDLVYHFKISVLADTFCLQRNKVLP